MATNIVKAKRNACARCIGSHLWKAAVHAQACGKTPHVGGATSSAPAQDTCHVKPAHIIHTSKQSSLTQVQTQSARTIGHVCSAQHHWHWAGSEAQQGSQRRMLMWVLLLLL